MSLGKKTLSGFVWTFGSSVGTRLLTLAFGILLARLLEPEDFGLVAMLYIFFEVSQSFVDSGFSQALIRETRITEEDKATAFSINIIVAVVFYALLWVSAPAIARFYDNEALTALTRFMGLTVIAQAFDIVQRAELLHGLRFKFLSMVTVVSGVVSGIIGVVMAFKGHGVWALAYQYVALSILPGILLWVANPWRPRHFIVGDSFRRMFAFGSKLFLSGLLNTVYGNIYKLIIGKLFSAATLGLYTQGKLYVDQVSKGVVGTLQRVTYPVLSKTREDPARLRSAYRRIVMACSYVIFPMTMGMALVAEPLILTLVGEKWAGSVPFMQIVCVSGALFHLHAINLNVLKVMGRSDLFLRVEIIKKVVITIAIFVGIRFGIWGLLVGSVISSYIALIINMYYTDRLISYSYSEQFKDLIPIVLHSIPMSVAVHLFVRIPGLPNPVLLVGGALVGAVVYLTTTVMLKSEALRHIVELLGNRLPWVNRAIR